MNTSATSTSSVNSPAQALQPSSGNRNPLSGITDRAHHAVDRLATKATPAIERASSTAHRTIDKVADSAAPAVDWATENSRQVAVRSSEVKESCAGFVRARPLASVAGALVVGYFAGRLLR
jgi:ElaB/YqjD/DUF883 family membrane-anchored ribosome-binding protein